MSEYEVGQRVWIKSVNARNRGPAEATVIKVGRTLVTVDRDWYGGSNPSTYRIETGRQNDQYGHQWIETDEQKATGERRAASTDYLHEKRVYDLDRAGLSLDALERIVEVMRADLAPLSPGLSSGADEREQP